MRIAIIGGGFTGLTAAYELAKLGHDVVLFEKEKTLGGLAAGFRRKGWNWHLEGGYHHLFTNDHAIFNLINELGLSDKLITKRPITATLISEEVAGRRGFLSIATPFDWKRQARMERGLASAVKAAPTSATSHIYQLDSPMHLLTFPFLTTIDKLRTAALLAFCKLNPFWRPLENITAEHFFVSLGGKQAWETIWEPLMVGKFGNYNKTIAASWLWARIKKRTAKLAYIEGGFHTLVAALEKAIKGHGGNIVVGATIDRINRHNLKFEIGDLTFDKVLLTVPTPVATKLIPNVFRLPSSIVPSPPIPHLHAQTLILETDKPILQALQGAPLRTRNGVYWLNITDRSFPFLAVVAHTNFMDKKHYGGHHITYFGNYLPDGHPYLSLSAKQILTLFRPFIKLLNPHFNLKFQISNFKLFQGWYAQPVHELRYSQRAPKLTTPIPNLYLANLDSIYPWDRGTNYAVELGLRAARTITQERAMRTSVQKQPTKESVFLKRVMSSLSQRASRAILRNVFPNLLIIVVLFLGATLRFTNLNWDNFLALHPDERNIAWAVTRIHFFDQLNPKFFAYGGLPIYFYRLLGEVVALFTKDPSWLTDWGKIALLGRYSSATLATMNIALMYLAGTRYFSQAVGLLSSALLTFSPWAIREAHFATTETMLVTFLLLLLLRSYRALKSPNIARFLQLGLILGLALATKTMSALFLTIPLLSLWTGSFDKTKRPLGFVKHQILSKFFYKFFHTLALLGTMGATFLLFSPFTILDRDKFLASMRYETSVVLGKSRVVYTHQFQRTIPYVYQFQTMLWQAGPVPIMGIAGLIGLVISFFNRKNRGQYLLVLIFPALYGLWSGSWYAKFARYNVPLLPFLTLAASWLLVTTSQRLKKIRHVSFLGSLVHWFIGSIVVLWGLANWTIYLRPQTRIVASEWIYENIPTGSILFTEHWNDGLPVGLPNQPSRHYQRELLTVYEPDGEAKLSYLAEKLPLGDFIILSTRRIWATMPRLKNIYPVTSTFYAQLFSGELGYREVARFTSFPSLVGITVNDDTAEETIQVFDHPTVVIFQNTQRLTTAEIQRRLTR